MMMFRRRNLGPLLPALSLAILAISSSGCTQDDDDAPNPDDDDDVGSTTRFTGTVFDEDTREELPGCEVGVTRSQAVRSDTYGEFSIDVPTGSIVNVRCEGAVVRSFELPPVAEIDWLINIDFWGVGQTSTDCLLDLEADLSGLGLDVGDGFAEVRVLRSDGTAGTFTTQARPTLQFFGFLSTPAGPFRVLTRAFGGSVPGFGVSDLGTCPGDASAVTVGSLVAGFPALVEREGTWEAPGEEPTLEVFGPWQEPEADELTGADVRLDHLLVSSEEGFQVSLIDGVVGTPLRARACRTGSAGRACVHRSEIAPTGPVEMGRLPQHMIVGARLGDGRLEMFTDRAVDEGAVTALLIDVTDPFNQVPLWKGWSTSGSLSVSTEWLGTVPPAEFLTLLPTAQERVEFDFEEDFSASAKPDGWFEILPAASDATEGG
jgi:hypothetical protein